MNDCCCDAIVDYKNIFKIFIHLFDKYPGNEEIIVRLAYTVGTIVAKLDNTREKVIAHIKRNKIFKFSLQLYHEKNSIENMLNLWKIYLEKTLKQYSLKSENGEDDGSGSEDVMIKVCNFCAYFYVKCSKSFLSLKMFLLDQKYILKQKKTARYNVFSTIT